MKKTELPEALKLTFKATNHFNANCYSYSYEARENKYGNNSNLHNCFLHIKRFVRNIKNQIGAMIYFHALSVLF